MTPEIRAIIGAGLALAAQNQLNISRLDRGIDKPDEKFDNKITGIDQRLSRIEGRLDEPLRVAVIKTEEAA